MTKVVCVVERLHIKIGKVYEIIESNDRGNYYRLFDDLDDGVGTWYHKNNFILLSEFREQQIKTILDD